MIKLQKTEPVENVAQKLKENSERLRDLLLAGGEIPASLRNYYRDPDVKRQIIMETFGKCAYCESKITHVDYGDVEHIIPKSVKPELTLEYQNLTLACRICNVNKGNYHDTNCPLINPYTDDPATEFIALGFLIWNRPGHDRAETTEQELDLNRIPLIERRKEKLDKVRQLAGMFEAKRHTPLAGSLRRRLLEEAERDKEYSLIALTYLKQCNIID